MEYYQMKYFCTLVRFGHFANAAGDLYISPPTLTNAIKKLEKELGVSLIDRSKSGFSLTPAGELFYEHSSKILEAMEYLDEDIHSLKNSSEAMTVYIDHSLNCFAMNELIGRFRKEHPNISLWTIWRSTEAIKQNILDHERCIAIVPEYNLNKRYSVEPFATIEFSLYASKDHPVLKSETINDENLSPYGDEILTPFHSPLSDHLPLTYEASHRSQLSITSNYMSATAVQKNMGLAIMPSLACENEWDLKTRTFDPDLKLNYVFIRDSSKKFPKEFSLYTDFVKNETIKKLQEGTVC